MSKKWIVFHIEKSSVAKKCSNLVPSSIQGNTVQILPLAFWKFLLEKKQIRSSLNMKWRRIVLIHRSSSFLYCYFSKTTHFSASMHCSCNIVIYAFLLHFTSHPLHRWSDPTFQLLDIFCSNQRSILQISFLLLFYHS